MKFNLQPKKPKNAFSKVKKVKSLKKREKESLNGKKSAVLGFASEVLESPEKIKLARALKKSNVTVDGSTLARSTKTTKSNKPKKVDVSISSLNSSLNDSLKVSLKNKKKFKKLQSVDSEADESVMSEAVFSASESLGKGTGTLSKGNILKIKENGMQDLNVKRETKSRDQGKTVKRKKTEVQIKSVDAKSSQVKVQKEKKIKSNETAVLKVKEGSGSGLNRKLLEGVCAGTLKLVHQRQDGNEKKDLFGSLPQLISLQVTTFKVPRSPYRMIRCFVPNSIQTSEPDVCLIVPDLQRGRKRDATFAKYVEQYEDKLRENGTKGIKQIIPFTQLRAEYSQFEMKRRLAKTFDVFLCDGRIQGHCVHFLGDIFDKAKKTPIPIHAVNKVNGKFTFAPNLQKEVNQALQKVSLTVHSHGTSYAVPIGHSQLTEGELADNIEAVWKVLELQLPGGIKNIRAAYLKGPRTCAVPLYASLEPPKDVPVVKSKRLLEPVEDELSTMPGRRVTVYPSGEVKLTVHRTEEDNEFSKLNPRLVSKKKSKKRKQSKSTSNDDTTKRLKVDGASLNSVDDSKQKDESDEEKDDEDDDDFKDVEAAEDAYLSQWSASASMKELENEEENGKQQSKKNKKKKKSPAQLTTKSDVKQSSSGKKGISQRFSKDSKQKVKKTNKMESKGKSNKKHPKRS